MGNEMKHHVFLESDDFCFGSDEKREIVNYFLVRRKSGGGECGNLQKMKDNVYRLSFKQRKDQEAVLQKSRHVVKVGLELTVRESLEEESASPTEEYALHVEPGGSIPPSLPAEGAHQPSNNETQSSKEVEKLIEELNSDISSEESEDGFDLREKATHVPARDGLKVFFEETSLQDGPAKEACDEILHEARGATARADGNFHVESVPETIEIQQLDVVVCPMVGHDPYSTRIGNTLFDLEGSELSRKFHEEAKEQTSPGDPVLVEGLAALPSRAVLFVHLVPWDNEEQGTAVEILKLAMNNILDVCTSRGFQSVALPLLGVGAALRFPEEVASTVLLETVYSYEWPNTYETPFLVRFVTPSEDGKSSRDAFQENESSNPKPRPTHKPPLRIALLGKTGVGKSSLANTIFGEELFNTDHTPLSETKRCHAETRSVQDKRVTLVDTPGFFDTEKSEEDMKPEIMRLITECSPGPHAIFIVLKVEKFTVQEMDVVDKILQYFTEEIFKYTVIVFTHGNQLPEGVSIEEFVGPSTQLSALVKRCDNRCHVVDNKYWTTKPENKYRSNSFQVSEILNTVVDMVDKNNGAYHSNAMFEQVEKEIQTEVSLLTHSEKNLPQEDIRKRAQKNVSKKFLTMLTGIATGALLGAFLEAVSSQSLMALLKRGVGGAIGIAMLAVEGAVRGGFVGYMACQDAESPTEAAQEVLDAYLNKGRSLKRP